MADLKTLEYTYSKNYQEVFEDIVTLMFCIDLGLSRGVNRRINQKAIESDPVNKNGCIYAYQAKYYEESTKLYQHKTDLIKCIKGASEERVTNLYLFVNKNKPDMNHKTGEESQYIKEIEDTAMNCNITLHWWTKSMIESSLDLEPFRYVREIYFGNKDDAPNYAAFYSFIYKHFSEIPKSKLLGDISLQKSYIEPYIFVDMKNKTVHEYLESWVVDDKLGKIAVICGEPGHGKTSLCHNAMCAFYKKGWLAGKVSNVFCFSLNPAMTDAIEKESFNIYSLLSWGNNRKNKKHILDETDCNNALIFLDGFDELMEWYPKFSLEYFLESEIVPFQKETESHIIITSRSMAVDSKADSYLLQDGTRVSIHRLKLITEEQQIKWIRQYTEYCREYSVSKAVELEEYLDSYKKIEKKEELKEILGVPIIFRLIVENRYLPTTEKTITQIYDRLFHATWIRHRKKNGTEADEVSVKEELQNHALRIFIDNNDTAETDLSIHAAWLFSFYTTHEGHKRVGFFHRSFYQYFLGLEILRWYIKTATAIDSEECIAWFSNNISFLARRKLDRATLFYIKQLHEKYKDSDSIRKAFIKAYEILKRTDGIIHVLPDKLHKNIEENVLPLEKANNVFWNIVSIGCICGVAISPEYVNMLALRRYELHDCILVNAQLGMIEHGKVNLYNATFVAADFRGANLEGAVLISANLVGTKLIGANLCKTNLRLANFSEADLSEAQLVRADLSEAKLSRAKLNGVKLKGALLVRSDLSEADFSEEGPCESDLREADFSESKLTGARLYKADLSGAKLVRADLSKANLVRANLVRANLSGADLSGADLSEADLSEADLSEANLSNAMLVGANLYGAKLNGAKSVKADFREANLREAKLVRADFHGANLCGVIFEKADLCFADLSGAKLERAKLREVKLRGAKLERTTLISADLSLVALSRANLREANLSGACLNGSNLSGADLSGADLSLADLSGANLKVAILSGAKLIRANFVKTDLSEANLIGANLFMTHTDLQNALALKSQGYDISELIIV